MVTRPPFQPFPRDRYDPEDLIRQLLRQQPRPVTGGWEFAFQTEPGEITAVLPDRDGTWSGEDFDLLRDVLGQIREMDNLVQDSCEKEHERSKLALRDFLLAIGHIDPTEPVVSLCYYGTGVNTVWDARFSRDTAEKWQPLNF